MRIVFSNMKVVIIAGIFFAILLVVILTLAPMFLNMPDIFTMIKKIFLRW